MKNILLALLLISTVLLAENNKSDSGENSILKKQLKKAMEDEKKFANEQKFYKADEYDFKGSEVNEESLKNIETIESDPNAYSSDFMDMPN
jgi:beta-glucanase (GH16 family)